MVKHTRRRGGAWYDPRTWFASTPAPVPTADNPAPSPSTESPPAAPSQPENPPYGGRKAKKSRRTKRRGTKSRRAH